MARLSSQTCKSTAMKTAIYSFAISLSLIGLALATGSQWVLSSKSAELPTTKSKRESDHALPMVKAEAITTNKLENSASTIHEVISSQNDVLSEADTFTVQVEPVVLSQEPVIVAETGLEIDSSEWNKILVEDTTIEIDTTDIPD